MSTTPPSRPQPPAAPPPATEAPDESTADSGEGSPGVPRRAPWIVHALGLALAALFIFLLAPEEAPPPPPPAARASAEATAPAAADSKEPKSRRARARQRGTGGNESPAVAASGGERAPVAVDSGFRRPLGPTDGDGELRPLYLTALLRVSDENILGGLQFNRSTYAPILKAGNATFDYGVAMHPPTTGTASATFRIPENARNFQATLALANNGSPTVTQCDGQGGSVTFLVKTDDAQAYRRIVVGNDGPHAQIQIELAPEMKTLTLITDSADGDSTCDGAVWAIARFMIEPPKNAAVRVGAGR